ncbi:MAG: nucleotidyl transferase AbiEii/AbiGii toxin family protein [Bifidobacteriaceae bacterium]|jgi:predicted nucleotidyltransferase component of viral defense system|nr:nucleotidyl transferase AbiEii/AbiGii toxin family protein [Bifidobacteriaceae bacterium]
MKNEAMSLMQRLKNVAEEKGINAQIVQQNYMFERFLIKLSHSRYKNNFILKGGFLVASLIDISNRTTKDIDALVGNMVFSKDAVTNMFEEILAIELDDNINFQITKVAPIREDDEYGGFRLTVKAGHYGSNFTLQFDISTGDIIDPPGETAYTYHPLFSNETIDILTYSLETILAEKLQTIFSRRESTTRMHDYFDVYIIKKLKSNDIRYDILDTAIKNTAKHRDTEDAFLKWDNTLEVLVSNEKLLMSWKGYRESNPYVENVEFSETIDAIRIIMTSLNV